ncbi:MAG: hypothetical protein JRI95_16985 [Deltaproteobacteria bacterium]|nr:hypothetical protein [Deltaproteobacteria bacterium]
MSEKTLVKVLSSFIVMILITLGPTIGLAASEPEGTLVVVRSRDAQFLDPNVATSDRSLNIYLFGSMVVRNLFDGKYSPHLAESWEVLDPKTWKFKLRQGVKFHNGDEVTSADVKFSFERSVGKFNRKFRGYRKGALKRQVASVETPDDYTVIIKTKFADASFLGVSMLMQVVPRAYVEKLGDQKYARKPVGFGPYKINKIRVGEYIEMEAFEDYWNIKPKPGEMRRSQVKTLILKTLPQQATMVAALKTGEADAMIGVQTDTSKELERLSHITVYYAPASQHGFFIINFRAEKDPQTGASNPLRDVRVRQALNYAINWDSIIKNYMTGREWRTTLIGRTQIGYDPNAPIYPYDPEKAKNITGKQDAARTWTQSGSTGARSG